MPKFITIESSCDAPDWLIKVENIQFVRSSPSAADPESDIMIGMDNGRTIELTGKRAAQFWTQFEAPIEAYPVSPGILEVARRDLGVGIDLL